MKSKSPSIDEILEKLGTYWYELGARTDGHSPRLNHDQAKAQLKALYLSVIPKKKFGKYKDLDYLTSDGFNQAITEITSKVEELFK